MGGLGRSSVVGHLPSEALGLIPSTTKRKNKKSKNGIFGSI
jgi:hypothetical protein